MRIRHDTRGVAMLELVLMLPFIWIVLALTIAFGHAYGERQRAMVAAREIAMRHSVALASRTPPSVASIADEVASEILEPSRMSLVFVYSSEDGTCPRDGDPVDAGAFRKVFEQLQGFIGDLSSSHSYRIEAVGQPPVGTLLRQPAHAVCFAIDSGSWTHEETGGPIGWLADRLRGLGSRIVGAIF